jgi:ABC-2 type transport system ATP-binding protein
VRCAGLVKRYADVIAVDGLSLEIFTGECFGLLGPNGAGKTTTIEILEGLTRQDAGEVEILGERWGIGGDRTLRQRLGVQLQETRLAEKLTVEETLRIFRSFYTHGRSIDDVLAIVELEPKRKVSCSCRAGSSACYGCALVNQPALCSRQPWRGSTAIRRRSDPARLSHVKGNHPADHIADEAETVRSRGTVDRGKVIALDSLGR